MCTTGSNLAFAGSGGRVFHSVGNGNTGPNNNGTSLSPHPRRQRTRSSTFPNSVRASLAFGLPFLPMRFDKVIVRGRVKLPVRVIEETLEPLRTRTVHRADIRNALKSLNQWYLEHGFLFSGALVLEWPSFKKRILIIACAESILVGVRIFPMNKDGTPVGPGTSVRTRPGTIARAMGLKVGAPFRWDEACISRLLSIGLFEQARVEVRAPADLQVELHLFVCEKKNTRIEPGIGMNSDGRIFGDISVLDNNFMGRAQTLRFEWQRRLDMVRSAGGFEFEDLRVGAKLPIAYKLRAYRRSDSARVRSVSSERDAQADTGDANTDYALAVAGRSAALAEYDNDRNGALLLLMCNLPKLNTTINAGPILETVFVRDQIGDPREATTSQLLWRTQLTHVTKEAQQIPRHGHRAVFDYVVGSEIGRSLKVFQKLSFSLSQHVGVFGFGSFKFSTDLGLGSSALPRHEQMPLGGNTTLRGYEYGELGRAPSFRTTRMEFSFPITKRKDSDASAKTAEVEKSAASTPKESGKPQDAAEKEAKPAPESDHGTFMEKLPSLVGVLFADSATPSAFGGTVAGSSYGVALRVGGMVNIELARGRHGREPRLHFSLVDHSR